MIDSTAALDVNGQIRIRGGVSGDGGFTGKVLTAANDDGLAIWSAPANGITKLIEGFGIDFGSGSPINYGAVPSDLTSGGAIAVWAGNNPGTNKPDSEMIQRRVANSCTTPNAITAIGALGTATCSPFVTSVMANANSGLTLTTPYGQTNLATSSSPITLAVNVGSGLSLAGGVVKLNVDNTYPGGGLMIDTDGTVKFQKNCANGETWKYNTGTLKWGCASLPNSSWPGESVMYLRATTTPATTAPSCPLPSADWGTGITTSEAVSSSKTNSTRVCWNSNKSCQVIYLKAPSPGPAPACSTLSVSWSSATVGATEWAPGGSATNYVNTCYLCN